MRKSIGKRILYILIFLTFLFTLNTLLSGITNSQVQLSSNLISNSFVNLQYEQVKLSKEMGQIKLSIQEYMLSDGVNSNAISENVLDSVESSTDSIFEIARITDEFSEKAMNNSLKDAYAPYFLDMEAYLDSAALIGEYINQRNRASANESYLAFQKLSEVMHASEREFQLVLDSSIDHEVNLINSRVNRSTVIVWSMAVIFVISALAAFWISVKTIITPLVTGNKSLHDIISKLEKNEGDLTARIDIDSEDEVGQMVKGINRFLDTLQNAMISIKSGSKLIYKSTENIRTDILESKNSTSRISSSLNELSASMEEISSTLQNLEYGAQNVLSSANDIADDAKSNSVHVSSIVKRADTVRENSIQSKHQMEEVMQNMKKTMESSIENSRSVEKINELTANILDISSKTNILAINASIEAARAGSVGKGFAVVGEEIRKLAESTKETASHIQSISTLVTKSVDELVGNANHVMSYISDNVLNDYDEFVEMANTYQKDVDTIKSMLDRFSTSSGELNLITTSMVEGMKEISSAVDDSVGVVIDSSESTNSLLESVTSISNEADHNKEIVDDLHHHVQKFKKVE
ncbi:methyl-accepting chemotaxis protein [Evansella sp. AB-rgal1]|uniref:methyl-accepting chemotaxis protein n=1 Tax=Evansella sp. AB-rgal1 TaxID=3242696 RepID=UPI00359E5F12